MNFTERLRRLEENLNGPGAGGDKYEPHPASEPPRWLPGDSVCECAGQPSAHRRGDHVWICHLCGGALLPSAIASIEKNFTAGEPAETD